MYIKTGEGAYSEVYKVKRVSDRFTVLRDGHTVATGETEQASVESIVEAMAGRRIEEYFPEVTRVASEPLLQVCELAGDPMPKDVTFDLCAGEVLGIAGLVGAGRSEALRVLFALLRLNDDVRVKHGTAWIVLELQPLHAAITENHASM